MKKAKAPITLNKQHSYITLRTPNGTYTYSWSGSKATGLIATTPGVFEAIEKYVKDESNKPGMNLGLAMEQLTYPNILETLFPNWNAPQVEPPKVKDMVIAPTFKRTTPGEVVEVKKKYAYVKWPYENAPIGIEFSYLQKV